MKAYVVFNARESHLIHTKMMLVLDGKPLAEEMTTIHYATIVRNIKIWWIVLSPL
jgi:hypothetical protein